jgi:hypothetical protein
MKLYIIYISIHLRAWWFALLLWRKARAKVGLLRPNFHFELIQIHSKIITRKGRKGQWRNEKEVQGLARAIST